MAGVFSPSTAVMSVLCIYVKDCDVDLSGPRANGYGAFCIGDRNIVRFDQSRVHVDGYALLVRGMMATARAEIINGCQITGNRFAVLCIGDNQTPCYPARFLFHNRSVYPCCKRLSDLF